MGLAIAQIQFLTLTSRKADCEYGISINSMHKTALAREMTELTSEYYSRLQGKQISYYANGEYRPVNYDYLMGNGNYLTLLNRDNALLKEDNSMILADYNGRVVLSKAYADAITSVIGSSAMDANGRGGTFSLHDIPAILANLCPGITAETFEIVINEQGLNSSYNSDVINSYTGEDTGENTETDNSANRTDNVQAIVDFYLPIFLSAASNGWTTEYNEQMALNDNYVSDAISSGTFQLTKADHVGNYDEGCTLNYFITSGMVEANSSTEMRAEITAWYEAQKQIISDKETQYDLVIGDLSTELEALKVQLKSLQSLIDNATSSIFDFGGQ